MSDKDKSAQKGEEAKTQAEKDAEAKKTAAIKRRLGKKADKAQQEAQAEKERNKVLEEENRILKEKLNPAPAQKPKLEDYGGDTTKFEADLDRWYQGKSKQQVKEGVAAGVKEHQNAEAMKSNDARTQAAIDDHYEKAQNANIEGYDQAEENALEWLGKEVVEGIIRVTDNAHEVLHLLGSNKDEADKLLETLVEDNVRGTAAIGRLSARAAKLHENENDDGTGKVPPENIPGGGNLPVSDAALKKRHDELVEACSNGTGDMKELSKVREQMREKGLIVD